MSYRQATDPGTRWNRFKWWWLGLFDRTPKGVFRAPDGTYEFLSVYGHWHCDPVTRTYTRVHDEMTDWL